MPFAPVTDFNAWLDETSIGFAPFPGYEVRGLDPKLVELLNAYQLGVFADDLATSRASGAETPALIALRSCVECYTDVTGFTVYRGLSISNSPEMLDRYVEHSISSWTLFSRNALNKAMAAPQGDRILLRYRLKSKDAALYIDNWEEEVLRGRLSDRIVGLSNHKVSPFADEPITLMDLE